MTLDPARPEKTRRGVWGGVAPPVGLGFGMRPPPGSGSARNTRSGSARNTRNYPSRVQEGVWVWVWDWVLGLGNISRNLENVADSDFQYFQDTRKYQKSNFQYFQDIRKYQKSNFQYFQDTRTPENQISDMSRSPEISKKQRFPIFPGFWE